jgi:hypothetical protein
MKSQRALRAAEEARAAARARSGRKGVDLKALKEAKRAKLTEMKSQRALRAAEEARAAAKARQEQQRDRLAMPPPPRPTAVRTTAMAPPRETTRPVAVLPVGFFDEAPATQQLAAPAANLPAGFSDADGGGGGNIEPEDTDGGECKGLVGYGSDDEDEEHEEEQQEQDDRLQSSTSSAAPGDTQPDDGDGGDGASTSTLPAGFFDNKDADLRARGIEPEAVKRAVDKKEIEEFLQFAEVVGTEAGQSEAAAEEAAADEAKRAQVEQMMYMNRLAPLLLKVTVKRKGVGGSGGTSAPHGKKRHDRRGSEGIGAEKTGDTPSPISGGDTAELRVESEAVNGITSEVSNLLMKKKKKKKRAAAAAFQGEYVPLDPLDWRSKAAP